MKVMVIGGGQVGTYLAKLLLENNCAVTVIENRESVVTRLKRELPKGSIVLGSGTDPGILESAGIAEADIVATVTGGDEINLVASTIAKYEFAVPRVISLVNNPRNAWLFNRGMGVDVRLNQADIMAHLILEEIDLKNILTLLKLNRGKYSILQVNVSDESIALNRAVKDLEIPEKAVLIAIYRNNKEVILPHGDTVILSGDNILIFSNTNAEPKINQLFGAQRPET